MDFERVGIAGHSQGGVAVINAITEIPHASQFNCAYILSPTNKTLAYNFLWDYDAATVSIPTILLFSTGQFDDNLAANLKQLQAIYDEIQGAPFKLMARYEGVDTGPCCMFLMYI